MDVGGRLKAECSKLQITQKAIAAACGVSPRAQQQFEAGTHIPGGAYLIAAAALGVDIQYVLTGQRALPLRQDEIVLLAKYRALPPDEQRKAQGALTATDAAPSRTSTRRANHNR